MILPILSASSYVGATIHPRVFGVSNHGSISLAAPQDFPDLRP